MCWVPVLVSWPSESANVFAGLSGQGSPAKAPVMRGYEKVRRAGSRKNGELLWLCRCGCGTERVIRTSKISPGKCCVDCRRQRQREEAAERALDRDYTGVRFGSKVVLGREQHGRWLAKCECGAVGSYSERSITGKAYLGCPSCAPKPSGHPNPYRGIHSEERFGQRYGNLLVVGRDLMKEDSVWWVCKCDCGKLVSKSGKRIGRARVCGTGCPFWVFRNGEDHHRYKHGMSGTREYQSRYRVRSGKRFGSLPRGYLGRLWKMQRGKCACCLTKIPKCSEGTGKVHVDHIVPVAAGGKHEQGNIQLLCSTCNVRKSSKDPVVWRQQLGYLI